MSFGLFTVQRDELEDPAALEQKLELATGELGAAARLRAALSEAAAADPVTESWHIVPATGDAAGWQVKPSDGG